MFFNKQNKNGSENDTGLASTLSTKIIMSVVFLGGFTHGAINAQFFSSFDNLFDSLINALRIVISFSW